MPIIKLSKTFVEKLPFNTTGKPLIYWDQELPAFGLSVGQQTKTYIVQRDIQGRSKRTTIGRHPPYMPDSARQVAKSMLIAMSQGTDLNEAKRRQKASLSTSFTKALLVKRRVALSSEHCAIIAIS